VFSLYKTSTTNYALAATLLDTVRQELFREINLFAAQYDDVYDDNSALKIQLAAARTYRDKEVTEMHAISDKEGTKYQALKEY
jgi:hypothetical protein